MRILLATESYWPTVSGVSVFTDSLARGLIEKGHKVAVIAPSRSRRTVNYIDDSLVVYRIPSLPNPLRNDARLVVRQDRRVKRAIRNFNPDIVHIQAPIGLTSQVFRQAKKDGLPIIATHHFSPDFVLAYLKPLKIFNPISKQIIVSYLRHIYDECTVLTCPTETVREQLLSYHISTPINVISNGVDTAWFSPDPKTRRSLDILYVGRLDSDKSIPMALEAVRLVLTHVPLARFTIVGGGNAQKKYQQWATDHNLNKSVTFCGRLPHDSKELRDKYRSSSLFIMPSHIETQSIVTMEAMACGLPVVACRGGALPELVEDKINGFLVEPHDHEQMAERISDILLDPEKAQEMGRKGRDIISSRHTIDHTIQIYEKIYSDILGAPKQPEA